LYAHNLLYNYGKLYSREFKMRNNLRFFRFFSGRSQQKLARELGISQPKISGLERGFGKLNKSEKKRIARILNVEIEAIFPKSEENR